MTGFFADALWYFPGTLLSTSANSVFAPMGLLIVLHSVSGASTFRDDDHGTLVSLRIPLSDRCCDFLPFEWDFRDKNHIRPTADSSVQCDPTCVPAHYFQDHCPFVTSSGRMESIQRIGHAAKRRVEAEGHSGRFDVVIDRLGNANNWETQIEEL